MKNNLTKFWLLDNPKHARTFLKEVRFGPNGAGIKYLQQADGKQVGIDDASDEQVLQVAKEIAEAMGRKKR